MRGQRCCFRQIILGLGLASAPLLTTPAHGFAPHEHHGLEAVESLAPSQVITTWDLPKSSLVAWSQWRATFPDLSFAARWDRGTGLVRSIFGQGLHFPNSSTSPTAAQAAAEAILHAHLDLWAPGAEPKDFRMVSNHYNASTAVRTVGFEQSMYGYRTLRGQWSVRIKNDRLVAVRSQALALPETPPTWVGVRAAGVASDAHAKTISDWLEEHRGAVPVSPPVAEPELVVLSLPRATGIQLELVRPFRVHRAHPISSWVVYLSAVDGEVVAAEQTLRFFDGLLQLEVPNRFPGNGRLQVPAAEMDVTVNGEPTRTSEAGAVSWTGSQEGNLGASFRGARARVSNRAGSDLRLSASILDGQTTLLSLSEEFEEAQLSAFYGADVASRYVEAIDPSNEFVRQPVPTNVNIGDSCNAFSDGESINFFEANGRCQNTALLLDVVMHEYAHTVHLQSFIRGVGQFERPLSEGLADYLASTISNDPEMGRGFFLDSRPLRRLDPPDQEARWPVDIAPDPHTTGLIFAGAMWDLRKDLVEQYGLQEGRRLVDQFWYAALLRATDIPSTYLEILIADDNDGDLSNGTPNYCSIEAAFDRHGLAEPTAPSYGPVELDQGQVTVPVSRSLVSESFSCPGRALRSAELLWRRRTDPSTGGRVTLSPVDGTWSGALPAQPDGEVVEYQIVLTQSSGEVLEFPRNPAAPFYEAYFGPTEPIYCTDFDEDPFSQGWTSFLREGLDQEGANDWQWGRPQGVTGSGDPSAAYRGERVVGNDLGGGNFNGRYQPNKRTELQSPNIDVPSFDRIRLQYRRWLSVEDGFYDQAIILADGSELWSNLATERNGETHHLDQEWRFHDVDLTEASRDGQVQVSFQTNSDGGLEFGGWTLDDFCVVGVNLSGATCGNGILETGEACDDGNSVSNDGCEADCSFSKPNCGDGQLDPEEMCDDGNRVDGDGCDQNCTFSTDGPRLTQLEGEEGCGCRQSARTPGTGAALALALLLMSRAFSRRSRS